jgi:hypothetical protein
MNGGFESKLLPTNGCELSCGGELFDGCSFFLVPTVSLGMDTVKRSPLG